MKKNIFILTAWLISICADAQINPKLRSIIYDQRPYGFYERDFDAKGIRIYAGGPIYHKADFTYSFTKERYEEAEQRFQSTRNTCRALASEALESYLWESHEEGIDTLMYILTLDNPAGKETFRFFYRPDSIKYVSLPEKGNELQHKGIYSFEYCLENGDTYQNHCLDTLKIEKYLKPVLTQKGIKNHKFYLYNDHTVKDTTYDFVHFTKTNSATDEIQGTIYTIQSKEQADDVLKQLNHAISQFIDENPQTNHWKPEQKKQILFCSTLSSNQEYCIFHLHSEETDTHYIMIFNATGTLSLPKGWQNMKSWVNGKIEYYRN